MKVKLNCERELACITPERFKHCLEHLLELHGAVIDRRQGLPKHVIYANAPSPAYLALAESVARYGLQLEPQGVYRV